jgi:hypothetical protein
MAACYEFFLREFAGGCRCSSDQVRHAAAVLQEILILPRSQASVSEASAV